VKDKNYRKLSAYCVLALLVFLPWLARNVIMSGYLIYPLPAIDLFNVDWKVPIETVQWEKGFVTSWAQDDFRGILYNPLGLLVTVLAFAAPWVVAWAVLKKHLDKDALFTYLVAFCLLVFWAILGPSLRFGGAYIAVAGIAPFLLLAKGAKKDGGAIVKTVPTLILSIGLFAFLALGSRGIGIHVGDRAEQTYVSYLYRPQSLLEPDGRHPAYTYTEHPIGTTTVFVSEPNSGCYIFPCTGGIAPGLEMRGERFEEGFRIKQ
jgi:hypothetical protein